MKNTLIMSIASLLLFYAVAAAVEVEVDATTRVVINGVDRIQDGLFGVDGLTGGNREELEAANMHTASGSSTSLGPVPEDPDHPGQVDRAALQARVDNVQPSRGGIRVDHFVNVIQGGPGWNQGPRERRGYIIPQRPEPYAEWVEALARYRLKELPDTQHYFMFFGEISLLGYWNKPEMIRDPRREGSNTTGRQGAKAYVEVLQASLERLKGANSPIKAGTAGLTSSLNWSNWRTWQSWWEYMIQEVGDQVDFYGVHWYDMTRTNLLVEAGLIQNAQELSWGNRKPICCQESDLAQGPMDNPEKGPFNAYFLWALMDMPDKVIVNINHLRDLGGSYFHNMFRASRRLPKYWAFWIMRDLRGTMLRVQVRPEAERPVLADRARGGRLWLFPQRRGIKARAAAQDNRLCVIVWNDTQATEQIDLSIATPRGQTPAETELSWVYFDRIDNGAGELEHGTGPLACRVEDERLALSFPARGNSIYAVRLDFPENIEATKALWTKEYFGDEIMFQVPGPTNFQDVPSPSPPAFKQLPSPELAIRADLKGARSVRLRVALDKPRGDWEDTLIRMNGKLYMLPVEQHVKRVALVEVPVDLADLRGGRVKLQFLPHLSEPYQVLWASLVVSNAESDEQAAPFVLRLEDPNVGLAAGETRTVKYTLISKSARVMPLSLRWVLPAGWSLEGAERERFKLPPRGRLSGQVTIRAAGDRPVEYQQIALLVRYPQGQVVARRSYKTNTPISCKRFAEPPTIDGALDDWQMHEGVSLPVGDRVVRVWTGWDVDNFYLAAFIPQPEDTEGARRIPRGRRALHVFLDLGNEKGVFNWDANDHHFWFVTPGLIEPERAERQRIPLVPGPAGEQLTDEEAEKYGWHAGYVGQTFWQGPLEKQEVADCPYTRSACKPVEGGYVIEAAIGGAWSWSRCEEAMYGYWPTVGQTIGFDFLCDDSGVDANAPAYYWGHGFEAVHSYYVTSPQEQVRGNPSLWGLLRFEE